MEGGALVVREGGRCWRIKGDAVVVRKEVAEMHYEREVLRCCSSDGTVGNSEEERDKMRSEVVKWRGGEGWYVDAMKRGNVVIVNKSEGGRELLQEYIEGILYC